MSAVAVERGAVESVCGSCGADFVDRTVRGPARSYCYECSPVGGRKSPRLVPVAEPIAGVPFTLEHFRAWCGRLLLVRDEPFELEEWEARFLEDLFVGMEEGWLREAWLIVPEGNGKSTLVALLILYCVEWSDEAMIPVAAASRDQAEIIFRQAEGFVRRSPALRGRFECKPGIREIVMGRGQRAKVMARDPNTADGIIPYPLEVIDELHRHQDLDLYRTWAGKLDKEQAVLVVISTAGEPGSEFEAVREQMRQSAVETDRVGCFGRFVGSTSVLHEYAVPEDGDVEDLELVKAANPSSRITVESLGAKRVRPSFSMPHWRRLTCNMPARSEGAAITEREWSAAYTDRRIPEGERIWLGLDLGWVHDTTSMVPLWVESAEFRLFGEAVILEPPSDGSQLAADDVERALREVHERNPIHTVVMDMTDGEQLSQWIMDELGVENVVHRTQSNKFAVMDYARFMEGLRKHWLWHSGDEGLRRHALNAVARMLPGGETRFDRPRVSRTVAPELQRRRVYDALQAAAMVHTAASASLKDPGVWAATW